MKRFDARGARSLLLQLFVAAALIYGIYAWRTGPLLPVDGATPTPPWRLLDTTGRERSHREFAGRPTVLYFFAPWCAICNASAHQLRWFDRWTGDDVALVMIALDYESPEKVAEYAGRHRIESPVVLGDAETAAAFRVFGYPTYYVVAPDGRLVSRDFGYTTAAGLWARTRLAPQREE